MSDAESNGIKILTWLSENPIIVILIKIRDCVGGTNMRGEEIEKILKTGYDNNQPCFSK